MSKETSPTKELFFSLLQDALWRARRNISINDYTEKEINRILRGAEMQAVSGLVIDALIRNEVHLPKKILLRSFTLLEKIREQNQLVNEGIEDLRQVLSPKNVEFVIIKGQVLASYYPDPLLRQSGDIDYYCNSKNFHKSQQIIKKAWNIEPNTDESDYHIHFGHNGLIYEGHFALVSFYNKEKDKRWQELLNEDLGSEVDINGTRIHSLSYTLHALYVFFHIYHHLMELGVGIRQFCDLAVMLHYCNEQINMDSFRRILKDLGMERAYRACASILVEYLGLSEEEIGYTLSTSDRKYGAKILNVVLYRGNMGHYNKNNGFRGWKHVLEAIGIKTSHFIKFMPLAPSYSCRWVWHEFGKKIVRPIVS